MTKAVGGWGRGGLGRGGVGERGTTLRGSQVPGGKKVGAGGPVASSVGRGLPSMQGSLCQIPSRGERFRCANPGDSPLPKYPSSTPDLA